MEGPSNKHRQLPELLLLRHALGSAAAHELALPFKRMAISKVALVFPLLCDVAAAKRAANSRRFFDSFFNHFFFNSFSDSFCFNQQYNSRTDSGQCENDCCWGDSCGSNEDCKAALIIGLSIMAGVICLIAACIGCCFWKRVLCFKNCCPRDHYNSHYDGSVSQPQPVIMGQITHNQQPIGHIITNPANAQPAPPPPAPPPAYAPQAVVEVPGGGPAISKNEGGVQA